MKSLPQKSAFGDPRDLDVKRAWQSLGGKSIEDAFRVFVQNPCGEIDNFRWVAPEAFVFYFPIVARYVTSEAAKGDSDTISSLAGILEFQLEHSRLGLSPVFRDIGALCQHIINCYEDYDLNYDLYGDVKSRYEQIAKNVEPNACT